MGARNNTGQREKVHFMQKKHQMQMQRVGKQLDKFRETAGVWYYWNIEYEEWNRRNHVGIAWADHEELCILC